MSGTLKLFRIFGIDVQLHFSWWLVFIFLSWSLSAQFFPAYFPHQQASTYWIMGVLSALLLFVSVLLHELSHSLVAKAKKIEVETITLFFFGGVAGINDEDLKPGAEFLMSIAGPLFSLVLAALFYLIHLQSSNIFWNAISLYLYQLNLVLGLFNLVPGYPLDGGRAFRALLNAHYKNLKKATGIAVLGGRIFAAMLIVLGVLSLMAGAGNGVWFIFLGVFLYFLAGISYEQVLLKEALGKISVMGLLAKNYVKLDPTMHFSQFLHKYLEYDDEVFVVGNHAAIGILDLKTIDPLSPKAQKLLTVKHAAIPFSDLVVLRKTDNAFTAYHKFAEQNVDILPVMEKNKLLGFVTRRKIMHRLLWSMKYGVGKNKNNKK